MSYILDALVKADRERQRQVVPGLHTIQVLSLPAHGLQPHWLAAVAGLGLAAGIGALAWWGLASDTRLLQASSAAGATPVAARHHTDETKPLAEVTKPARPAIARDNRQEKPPGRPAPIAKAAVARPEARLYSIAELPPALQKDARNITISGFAHASDANARMAIINDRALREGDEVTGGLRVERISSDGVVFNFKGYRFRKGGA